MAVENSISFNSLKLRVWGVSKFFNESAVKITKLNMEDPIWRLRIIFQRLNKIKIDYNTKSLVEVR